jgi:hypothetical protein
MLKASPKTGLSSELESLAPMHCRPVLTHFLHGRESLHLLPYAMQAVHGVFVLALRADRRALPIILDEMSIVMFGTNKSFKSFTGHR